MQSSPELTRNRQGQGQGRARPSPLALPHPTPPQHRAEFSPVHQRMLRHPGRQAETWAGGRKAAASRTSPGPALASGLQPGGNSEIPAECCPGLLASPPQPKPACLGRLTPGFHFPEASGCSHPLAHSWSRVRETSWQAGSWPRIPRLHKRGRRGGPAQSAGWGKRRD